MTKAVTVKFTADLRAIKALVSSQRLLLDALEAMSDQPQGSDACQGGVVSDSAFNSQIWDAQQRILERSACKQAGSASVAKPESAAPASVESYWPTGEVEEDPAPQPEEPEPEGTSTEEHIERAYAYTAELEEAYERVEELSRSEVVTSSEPVVISTETVVDSSDEVVETAEPVAVPEPEPEPRKEAGTVISQVVAAYEALKARGETPDSKSIGKEIGRSPANVSAHLCFARQRGLIPPAEKPKPAAPAPEAQEPEAPKPRLPRGGATKGIEVSADFTAISGPLGQMPVPEKLGRMLAVMASGYLFAEDRLQKAAGVHARTWPADQLKYHRATLLAIGITVDHQKGVGWRIKPSETGRPS